MKNVFLTGEKGIGKTTAIRQYLSTADLNCGGFVTVKTFDEESGHYVLCLLRGYDDIPSKDNTLVDLDDMPPDTGKLNVRFNELGYSALSDYKSYDLIIMDELGPHEENAYLFHEAVFRALDSAVPVLGVLQEAESSFLNSIKARTDTLVITVTEDNRDEVPFMISCEPDL